MPANTDLPELIRNMHPLLQTGSYVFCTVEMSAVPPLDLVVGMFREKEGVTVIVEETVALQLGLCYTYVAAWITLQVHSALEAVGLTAAFSSALAREGISCNVVAGYYHDHLFVAKEDGERAVEVLKALAANV